MQRSTFSAENFLLPQLFTPCPSEVRSATLSVERMEHVERIEHVEHCALWRMRRIQNRKRVGSSAAISADVSHARMAVRLAAASSLYSRAFPSTALGAAITASAVESLVLPPAHPVLVPDLTI